MRDYRFFSDGDCEVANKEIDKIVEDPMTEHYGIGGEMSQEWLRKHVKECDKCKQATFEGNMP